MPEKDSEEPNQRIYVIVEVSTDGSSWTILASHETTNLLSETSEILIPIKTDTMSTTVGNWHFMRVSKTPAVRTPLVVRVVEIYGKISGSIGQLEVVRLI